MINFPYASLFNSSCDKQWIFESDDITLTNDDFVLESLVIEECAGESETYTPGSYSASKLTVSVYKTNFSYIGQRFAVSLIVDGHTDTPLTFQHFTVYSDKLSSDRRTRELVMYDDLYNLDKFDISYYYNAFMEGTENVTGKDLRDWFFQFMYNYAEDHPQENLPLLEQEETTLPNDNVIIPYATTVHGFTASQLFKSILHFNCCNGIMGRNDKVRYVFPPAYGATPAKIVANQGYRECRYEEYQVQVTSVIVQDGDKAGITGYGIGGTGLTLTGNTLFYKNENLGQIATNVLSKLNGYFTPFECTIRGNPCIECGDVVEIHTDTGYFQSYIIKRTISGIQGLLDEWETQCPEQIIDPFDLGDIAEISAGYIGDSSIEQDEDGNTYIDHANTAWKLRSAKINDAGDRYYTYLTKNKNFVVSNDEYGAHTAENDVTDQCQIGSKSYPWKAGYFNELHVGSGDSSRTVQEQFIAMIRNIGFRLLQEPSNVSVVYDPLPKVVRIKWEDPDDLNTNRPVPAIWAGTVVIRGESADMLHRWDGELIAETTVRNQYSLEELIDDTIEFEEGETYYYGIFPYDDNGCYRFTKIVPVEIIPMPIPDITSLSAQNTDITVTWHVPTEYEWESIKLVYKKGSVPQNDSDGRVIEITESGGTILQNLSEYSTYYFKVFSVEESTYFEFESEEQHINTSAFGAYRALLDSVTITRAGSDYVEDEIIITKNT